MRAPPLLLAPPGLSLGRPRPRIPSRELLRPRSAPCGASPGTCRQGALSAPGAPFQTRVRRPPPDERTYQPLSFGDLLCARAHFPANGWRETSQDPRLSGLPPPRVRPGGNRLPQPGGFHPGRLGPGGRGQGRAQPPSSPRLAETPRPQSRELAGRPGSYPNPPPADRPRGRGPPRPPAPPSSPAPTAGRRPAPIGRPCATPRPLAPLANERALSASQPGRLGGSGARVVAERRAASSEQRLRERPVGRVPAPRTPARPAGPALSMGAAAVRWHLYVLLALGVRGRLAWGSGLPGKPRPRLGGGGRGGRGRPRRRPGGSFPAHPELAPRGPAQPPTSFQSNFWGRPGAPPPHSPGSRGS
ncbi:hypothetical protein P7K49_002351 [Saguinus oedipus]|uniref:Basic proline-rich protein-like n=1 Tax=Saguinus oedipus TaxID=9490 RepID=A0ABQ9WH35_SAGOE|nr:hypothetical protein P7K49_002351 [Saguinus oedipus]